MIASIRMLLKYLIYFAAFLVAAVLVVLIAFDWAAKNRETSALGENLPLDGNLLPTKEGQIFLIDQGDLSETQLLFAHGTAAWSGLWRPTLHALALQGFRATAFDMPPFGFGEHPIDMNFSRPRQAERVIALLEALGTKPIIVTHSVGAGPTTEAVLMRPDLVSGLVVVDGAIALNSHQSPKNLPFMLQNDTLRRMVTSATASNPYLTKHFLRGFVHVKDAVTPEMVEVLQEPMVRKGYTNAVSNWVPVLLESPMHALSTRETSWKNLDLPVVFIWGQEDTITPLDQAHEMVDLVKGAELIVLEGVGHIPQIEAPQAFQAALNSALKMIEIRQ